MGWKVVAAVAGSAGAALVAGLAVLAGGPAIGSGSETSIAVCAVTGPVAGLSGSQAANAETVAAVAEGLSGGSAQPAEIALMTAYTESRLVDLGPMTDNAGSLGLFQQRATQGWGTPAAEEDPRLATAMFVTRLLDLPGWSTMPPWLAAQTVQRSAFADGSNYQANWPLAATLLTQIEQLPPAGCGQLPGAVPAGPASRHGLPANYTIPTNPNRAERAAVIFALAQLGKPYVWGAAGPAAYDCSGLTMMAWAAAGDALAHYTGDQLQEGTSVPDPALMSPGDLVLVPGSDGTLALPGHVGIYLGDGLVESAVDPAEGVTVQTFTNFTAAGLSGIRQIA